MATWVVQTAQQDLQALRGRWTEVKAKLSDRERGMSKDVEEMRAELRCDACITDLVRWRW